MRSRAASCQNSRYASGHLTVCRAFVFFACTGTILASSASLAFADLGDGKFVYGESGSGILRTRDYTDSSNTVGAEGNAATAATVNEWVIMRSSPVVENEYIAASTRNTTNDSIYIQRYDPGSSAWAMEVSNQAGIANLTAMQHFDVAYESQSGNALVLYSTGAAAANQLAYYYYISQTETWLGPCNQTSARVGDGTETIEWVFMASSKSANNPNEIAAAFSDTGDDLSAMIWTPTSETPADCAATSTWWADEHSAALTSALSTVNAKKFDVAYESNSGDVMVAWYAGGSDPVRATNPGSGTGWTITAETGFNNAGIYMDLCSDPDTASDEIALASLTNSATSADTDVGVWTGSAFGNIATDTDAVAEVTATANSIACGFVGDTGRVVVVYDDEETDADMDWLLYIPGTGWAAQTDVTYVNNAQERMFEIINHPDPATDKIMLVFNNSLSDIWAMRYDNSAWTVMDGTAGGGNDALEASGTAAIRGTAGFAYNQVSATPVAQVLQVVA